MREYIVALKKGVDYEQFWQEMENHTRNITAVPDRRVDIVNERPLSLRSCHYALDDSEAERLRLDPRVLTVEIPPQQRDDIEIAHLASQTGDWLKSSSVNPTNPAAINWGLFRLNSNTNNTASASGQGVYNYPLDGSGVDVVIQDGGITPDHPELADSQGVSRVQKINWYTSSGVPGIQPADNLFYADRDGHGTMCAGIVAGRTYGRAKNARIYSQTVDGLNGSGTDGMPVSDLFDTIKGWHLNKPIDPVTGYRRPTVVNMSWGYVSTFSGITGGNYRGTDWVGTNKRADYGMIGDALNRYGTRVISVDVDVDELLDAGVILVGAAGNYSQKIDLGIGDDYDNYFINNNVNTRYYMRGSTPTSTPGVICVGAIGTGSDPEQRASYSDAGPRIDVWAPGSGIISSMSNPNRFGATTFQPGTQYLIGALNGTSFSCPNVAGVVAQLLQVHPTATPNQMVNLLSALSAKNVIFSTGSTTDYSDTTSLLGAPNQYCYMPYNSADSFQVQGAVAFVNLGVTA